MIKKILVVCTGNSCRSPMAEGFLKKYLGPEGDFEIISVGTSVETGGFRPTPEAIEVMKEAGIDISTYVNKPFLEILAKVADLILVMAGIHKEFILEKLPEVKDKLYLFKEFAGGADSDRDITDPIGQTIAVYRSVREEIKKASLEIVRRIKEDKD